MKRKTFVLLCCSLWALALPLAAQERSAANMARRAEEMTNRQADRLADEFGLKDEARADFVALYKNYRQEVNRHRLAEMQQREENAARKAEVQTDEEATARIQAEFDRKTQAIVDAYNTLEVEKKYYAEFGKMLSPRQLVKIFVPERPARNANGAQQRAGRNGNRQGGRGFGGFGGPQDGFGGWDD